MLKRLARAVADGDRIYAIVRGSAVNNDGNSGFLATPARSGQEQMLRRAYADARISPGAVRYVEAHGTGTRAGDPVELLALGTVLAEGRPRETKCGVGSVKTNIGHTEGAAGVAGLIKVALSLSHRTLPRSLNIDTPTPDVPWSALPIELQRDQATWPEGVPPVVAGVSSFGIAGTNAHVVLEESPPVADHRAARRDAPTVLPISSHTEETLDLLVADYLAASESGALAPLEDLCYTAAVRRQHQRHRCAIVLRAGDSLAERLRAATAAPLDTGIARGIADVERRPVVFIFPGQGSQWLGMGRDLFAAEPVFRDAIRQCDAVIQTLTGWSLIAELHADASGSRLADIAVAQPLLCAYEIALAALWRAWGIQPDAVVGHSMGEVAAAYVAGVLSLDDAMRVICTRSMLLRRVSGLGAMAAVELSVGEAEAAIEGYADRVSVAVSNSRRSTVLAGDPAALDAILATLESHEVFCRRVKVDVASHSPQMDPLVPDLLARLSPLVSSGGTVPFYSSVVGRLVEGGELDAAYWTRNLRQPVQFATTLERLLEDGHVTFIEMSPHPLLVGAVEEAGREVSGTRVLALGSARRDESERANMLDGLARVYAAGHDVDWAACLGTSAAVVSLPPYRWLRERFWYNTPAVRPTSAAIPGPAMSSAVHDDTTLWEFSLSLDAWPQLRDHKVRGRAVVPAALYVLLMREAAGISVAAAIHLVGVRFEAALDLDDGREVRMQVAARREGTDRVRIDIFSAASPSSARTEWTRHASGMAVAGRLDEADAVRTADAAIAVSQVAAEFYARLDAMGLGYGPAFRRVRGVTVEDTRVAGVLVESASTASSVRSPILENAPLLDGAFQVLLEAASRAAGLPALYVPVSIAAIDIETMSGNDAARCEATLTSTVTGTDSLEGDVVVVGADGKIAARARGVRFERIGQDSAPDQELFELVWTPAVLPGRISTPSYHGVWLVFADRAGLGDQVAALLTERGGDSILVRPIASDGQAAAGTDVRPGVPEDYQRIVRLAAARGPIRACIHLWSLDIRPPGDDAGGWVQLHESGALGALYLAQACLADSVTPDRGLSFITASSQAVTPRDGTIAVVESPIWGFASVLRAEHPELRPLCIDVEASDLLTSVGLLVDEVAAGNSDERVAFRAGLRYVSTLAHVRPGVANVPLATPPAAHRPFRIYAENPGRLDSLAARPLVRRPPSAREVEIEVDATGLNFMNVMSAMGIYPGYPNGLGPLGIECSGRVVTLGAGVTSFRPGEPVMAMAFDCLGSHALADAHLVMRRPSDMDSVTAAGVPIAFLTAHYALSHLARLQAGERVLIHSAASGVGQAAVQLARRAGAEIVATAGSAEKRASLRAQGIEHVFDSRSGTFAAELRQARGGDGVDVVLNSLTGDAIPQGLALLRSGGRFVEIGKRDIYDNRQIGLLPFQRNLSYFAVDLDRMARDHPARVGAVLREVMDLLVRGEITPLPTRVFPRDGVADAFREMGQGVHTGKLVIDMTSGTTAGTVRDAIDAAVGGTVLVTGGFGAIGLTIAEWLIDRGVDQVALLGRHPDSVPARAAIARLEARGVRVLALGADVANRTELARALDRLRREMPPLTGVIHAAGVLDDATVAMQTAALWHRVFDGKAAGAWYLDELTAGDPLTCFVLISSVASFLGLAGQANYAAANAWLDALSAMRRRRDRPAISIGYGPWAQIGLASSTARGGRLARLGLGSLTPERARAAFDQVMAIDQAHVAVMSLDVNTWTRATAGRSSSLLTALARTDTVRTEGAADAAAPQPALDLRAALAAAPPGRLRRQVLEGRIRLELGRVLRLAVDRIDVSRSFRTLGLDSLMGLELRHRLEQMAAVPVTATAVWNHPTVSQLAVHLAGRLGVLLDAPEPAAPDPAISGSREDDLAQILADIEQLSDEDVDRLAGGNR